MGRIPDSIRGAVTGFVILLSKGSLDDDRWNWDVEQFDCTRYQAAFCDPTILRTTLTVFLNNLELGDGLVVVNYEDARFRGFQYFRGLVDSSYSIAQVHPPFQAFELEEPDWRVWEA
jgi:hypothetical protein